MSNPHDPNNQPDPEYPDASGDYPPADAPEGAYPQQDPSPSDPYPPADAAYPQAGGAYPPADGAYPPAGGSYPPADGAYPPAGGSYPPADGAYPAAPPVKKKTPPWMWLVALFLVGAIVGVIFWLRSGQTAAANVGDCIAVTDATAANPDTERISCDDPKAVYVVTEVANGDLTCDNGENAYQQFEKKGGKITKTLCLRPNAKEGDCFDESAANGDIARVACDDPKASVKFTKVDTSKADETLCPAATATSGPWTLPKRNVTYCLELVSH